MAITRSSTGNSKDRGMLQKSQQSARNGVKKAAAAARAKGSKIEKTKAKASGAPTSKAKSPKSKTAKQAEAVGKAELNGEVSWTGETEVHVFDGLLFDFDGTLIDSTEAIIKHWHKLGKELGVDPEVILADSHGRRSIDTLKMYDESKANWEYISHIEGLIPKEYGQDAIEIPGARPLLNSLDEVNAPWAVVTSGTSVLANGWMEVMKLARPKNLVVAEDVEHGKPHPECYLLGRSQLQLSEDAAMLVVEDAPSGVKAGKAAGFKVLGLGTTHDIKRIKEAGADWIVKDLSSVGVKSWDQEKGKIEIEIRNALRE